MTNANDNHDASWGSDPLEDEHMDDGIEGGFDDGFDGSMDGPASPAGPEQGRPEADKPCTCGQGEHCSCTPVARGGRGGRVAGPRSRPESRDILIFGPITPMMAREVTQHLLLLDQEDSTQPIRVLVNSPGGTSDEAFGLVDVIRFLKAPVFTLCVGQAARSAALVMAAPPLQRRFATSHATFTLAMPMGGVMGSAADIDVAAREVGRQKDKVLRLLADATGQPLNKLAKDVDRPFALTADEAVAYGLVARVIASPYDLALAGAVVEPPAAPVAPPEALPEALPEPEPVPSVAPPAAAPEGAVVQACGEGVAAPAETAAPASVALRERAEGGLRGSRARTAFLFGTIQPGSAQAVIRRLLALDEEAPREGITLFVNSPGGCAASGFAILDVLQLLRAPVTTICTGKACSAATLVMLAPPRERRFILPHARMMLHQPSMTMRGTALDVEIAARGLVRLRERANAFYSRATGQPLERIAADVLRDCWMDSEASVAYGLVGRVLRSAADLPPAA